MRQLAPLTVAMVFFAAIPEAMAQRRFEVGLKTGPSFTDIAQDEDDGGTYHRRIAAAGGGWVRLALGGPVSVQGEALSTPKGTRLELPDSNVSETLMLRYFEAPFLLRLDAPAPEDGGWYVFGGGYFAVRTSAKVQTHFVDNNIESGTRDDASDVIERYDHGWVAGAGYDIGRYVVVEGRYARGLANVNRIPDSVGFTNRALTFMVGFRY
jgi:Outer membrane protein beta-barrel domain